jgi:hypothetical protein
VVTARIITGEVKLAQVQVEEVFRGSAQSGQRLQIAFRDFNMDLSKSDRIVFSNGEKEILFLKPELNLEGERKGENRYTLYRGRFGRFTLPREGEEIYIEALHVFSSLASEKDFRKLYARIQGMLGSPNPILADAGLRETLRLDLMNASLVPVVISYFQDPSPPRRAQALKLLGRLFRTLKPEIAADDVIQDALSRTLILARNDPEESVRVASVEALGFWSGDEALATLKAVADQDPAQSVRFEAKVILLRRSQGRPKSPPASQP